MILLAELDQLPPRLHRQGKRLFRKDGNARSQNVRNDRVMIPVLLSRNDGVDFRKVDQLQVVRIHLRNPIPGGDQEVLTGLKEGEQVVVSGQNALKDGQKVAADTATAAQNTSNKQKE